MSFRPRLRLLWACGLFLVLVLGGCDCEPPVVGDASELTATPKSLTFDAIQGAQQTKLTTIRSRNGDIIISKIEVLKGGEFYSLNKDLLPPLPYTLENGKSFPLNITYSAAAGESAAGTIRIYSDATTPRDGLLDVRLLATSNRQRLLFKPSPVDFGALQSDESKEIEVVAENLGRADLNIQKVELGENASQGFTFPDGLPKTPLTVKPGESFKFKIKYQPTTAKQDQADLLFTCAGGCAPDVANQTTGPTTLRVIGELAEPIIALQPNLLDFGFVVGDSTQTRPIVISNSGNAPLKITSLKLDQNGTGFSLPADVKAPLEIEAGKTKELQVTFAPKADIEYQGTITIESNDPSQPKVLAQLYGKISSPKIRVTPKEIDFGRAPVSTSRTFVMANAGDRVLEVKSIKMTDDSSKQFEVKLDRVAFPIQLRPNGFKAIQVDFLPQGIQSDTGKIIIESNDPGAPTLEVGLRGTGTVGTPCELEGSPNTIRFGLTFIGKTKDIPVRWTNIGGTTCKIEQFETNLDKTGTPPYTGPMPFAFLDPPNGCARQNEKVVCSKPLEVKPGGSFLTTISFAPQAESPAKPPVIKGTLTLTLDTGEKRAVALEGLATTSCIEYVPSSLDLGIVTVDCSSRQGRIVIYNQCSQPIEIKKIGFSDAGANGFVVTRSQLAPFKIDGGQSTEINVVYRATPPARRQNAVLQIEHDYLQQSPISIPLTSQGSDSDTQTDNLGKVAKPKVDILFVIDNSCSMGDEQASLGQNFQSFIKWASTLKVDYHIGVTTTDTRNTGQKNKLVGGELVGSPTPASKDKFLTANTPNIEQQFVQRATVGVNGSGREAGLEAARLALSHPLATTGANAGFLRNDATLSIIAISDEPDQSPSPPEFYINFFQSLKGNRLDSLFRFSAVIGISSSGATRCSGQWGNGPGGSARSSGRYAKVAKATAGLATSICTSNWSDTLNKLGAVTFGIKTVYNLTRDPDPKSIQVKINGKVVPKGADTWDYSSQENGIAFNKSPDANVQIEVTYKAICY